MAGLNQGDILDAVIDKVSASKRGLRPSFVIDIIQAALNADVADSSEAFNKFMESESVISLIKGENSAQLRTDMKKLG